VFVMGIPSVLKYASISTTDKNMTMARNLEGLRCSATPQKAKSVYGVCNGPSGPMGPWAHWGPWGHGAKGPMGPPAPGPPPRPHGPIPPLTAPPHGPTAPTQWPTAPPHNLCILLLRMSRALDLQRTQYSGTPGFVIEVYLVGF